MHRGVQSRPEAPGQLDVEGVEVDVADTLKEFRGPGVGQGLGQLLAPGLVSGLQGAELGQDRSPPCRPQLRPCAAAAPGRGNARVSVRRSAMKTGVEPRQLLAVPQAAHRDAHRKTPLAQFRFEKLSIPLARKKDDRLNTVEARREHGKHAVGPSAPFLVAHRVQGLFVGPPRASPLWSSRRRSETAGCRYRLPAKLERAGRRDPDDEGVDQALAAAGGRLLQHSAGRRRACRASSQILP